MTRPDIAAIRERAEAATPGPWHVENHKSMCDIVPPEQYRHTWKDGSKTTLGVAWGHTETPLPASHLANGEFIAHAREDVPALLDYVAELERLVGEREGGGTT